MKRIILNIMATLALTLVPATAFVSTASATCSTDPTSSKTQVESGIGTTGSDCSGGGVNNIFSTVVSILSTIVGVVAILMVIFGGFKYITSGGESGKVSNAKSTILYALIGLAVAALAQLIVHFVLNQTTIAEANCDKGYHYSDKTNACAKN